MIKSACPEQILRELLRRVCLSKKNFDVKTRYMGLVEKWHCGIFKFLELISDGIRWSLTGLMQVLDGEIGKTKVENCFTCTKNAISITKLLRYPRTRLTTPLATVDDPISIPSWTKPQIRISMNKYSRTVVQI